MLLCLGSIEVKCSAFTACWWGTELPRRPAKPDLRDFIIESAFVPLPT